MVDNIMVLMNNHFKVVERRSSILNFVVHFSISLMIIFSVLSVSFIPVGDSATTSPISPVDKGDSGISPSVETMSEPTVSDTTSVETMSEPTVSDTTSVEKESEVFLADDLVVEEDNELKEENIELTLESTIGNISKDEQISVKISVQEKTKTTIQQVDFTTSSDQKNVELTVSNLKNKPMEVTKEINMTNTSKVYKYLDIKLTSDDQYIGETGISTMTFTFAVEKTWIENENIDKQSVEMMRCHNDTWQHLNTTYINESETVIYYQAETPGLSVFAVVGSANVMSSDTYAPETANIPLEAIIGIITAIVALLIIVLFKARYIYFGDNHTVEKPKKKN